jgi:hypothetical protein
VRPFQGVLGAVGAEPEHEAVLDDPAEHVAVEHERQAAEHLPLGYRIGGREYRPDPVGQVFVVGHESSARA